MKIYFAGSIRGGREFASTYFQIINFLKEKHTVLTEHIGSNGLTADGEDRPIDFIYKRDRAWIEEADLVVAEVSQPSIGVGWEIGYAQSLGKKIICLYFAASEKKLSSMIEGNSYIKVIKYSSFDELRKLLEKRL